MFFDLSCVCHETTECHRVFSDYLGYPLHRQLSTRKQRPKPACDEKKAKKIEYLGDEDGTLL